MPYILRRDRVFFVADHDKFHSTSEFFIARIALTNARQDFRNENSSSHELNKITRESKVTSFKFRFIPKARRIPHQQRNHVLVATSPAAK